MMNEWIEYNENTDPDLIPENGEVFIMADNISGFISLAVYDEEEDNILMMSIYGIEPDSCPTHLIRIPPIPI